MAKSQPTTTTAIDRIEQALEAIRAAEASIDLVENSLDDREREQSALFAARFTMRRALEDADAAVSTLVGAGDAARA